MKVVSVIGTRPEIIKMFPIIKFRKHILIHTNQHYSYEMDKKFFEELELPQPEYNLNVGSGSHAYQTGTIMIELEKLLEEISPNVVMAEGDTNSVLATALVCAKLHIKFAHVEAGLRSYDRRMPEEINRIVADHVADILFAPTKLTKENLLRERVEKRKIFVTGNTIVDSIYQIRKIAKKKSEILEKLNLQKNEYFLLTLHRAENVDNKMRLKNILEGLNGLIEKYGLPIIFPIHPRTKKMIEKFKLKKYLKKLTVINPFGYLDFINLEENAKLILTDSGGVQEEACILKVPCITMRDNTERPETIEVGANILVGDKKTKLIKAVKFMLGKKRNWKNPFGDGKTAKRIWKILDKLNLE